MLAFCIIYQRFKILNAIEKKSSLVWADIFFPARPIHFCADIFPPYLETPFFRAHFDSASIFLLLRCFAIKYLWWAFSIFHAWQIVLELNDSDSFPLKRFWSLNFWLPYWWGALVWKKGSKYHTQRSTAQHFDYSIFSTRILYIFHEMVVLSLFMYTNTAWVRMRLGECHTELIRLPDTFRFIYHSWFMIQFISTICPEDQPNWSWNKIYLQVPMMN